MSASGCCGILLAAGRATRFGSDKLLHPLPDGTPIVLASARALGAALPRLVAVVAAGDGRLARLLADEGIATVVAADAAAGMGASLAAGVAAVPDASAWLVALADMPFIRVDSIARVAAALAAGAALAAPIHGGRRGHPVGFSGEFRAALLALRGDQGARAILDEHRSRLRLVECPDPGILRDIDRPEDLK